MSAPSIADAVSIVDLRVDRGKLTVLHDISLAVPSGSITGLLGPSGCGKTTLMRAIVGTQIVESGDVTVLGEPAGSAGLRKRVGYVTQAPSIYNDLTVHDNVAYFGALYRKTADDVAAAIDLVGLSDRAGHTGDQLSGGQRTRVSLACALVADPDLIVLDEPTVGLDPVLRADLWDSFHALAARGRTLLVSSHVMDEAEHCDRLLLMRDGRLLANLTPEELRKQTGESSLEAAFLTLIRESEAGR
ncbi:MAG: ABC transporter ATP-binding protein [Gordonia sp. (in: high G+C Gram-positive bacteria)]|uniref:ABC transporter ATP-binding protein n=1 Tax=Gordonia sp. (in: high G+C Gram-positive bacteria) TaxID=84139 RepID=UPI0039E49270